MDLSSNLLSYNKSDDKSDNKSDDTINLTINWKSDDTINPRYDKSTKKPWNSDSRAYSINHCRPTSPCVSDTFPNAPANSEEDEEKEIYFSSKGEGQFIAELSEGVFPRDQSTR